MIVERKITEIGWQIYGLIKAAGEFGISRKDIALALNKRWNVWDTVQIERLIDTNLVSAKLIPTGLNHMSEYVYTATETE